MHSDEQGTAYRSDMHIIKALIISRGDRIVYK